MRERIDIGTIAVAHIAERPSRLVLVVGVIDGIAQVDLLTNEIDLATATDVLLETSVSGLPYRLLVETDMMGPVSVSRLEYLAAITAADVDRLLDEDGSGLPLLSRRDSRWAWKESELGDLSRLLIACSAE